MNPSPVSTTTAGLAVAGCTGLAVFGPLLGLSPAWIALLVGGGLLGLTLDASQLEGMGGHLLAEALPGGRMRLRRVARFCCGELGTLAREACNDRKVLCCHAEPGEAIPQRLA